MKIPGIPQKYIDKIKITALLPFLLALYIVVTTTVVRPDPVQAASETAGWILFCNYSHSLRDDPIVFPNQPGAAHLHDFVGAQSTNAFSTFDSLRAGGTACILPGDTSSYWVPALYENGVRVLPTGQQANALLYYRRVGAPEGTIVQPFPPGLKILIGNAHAMSPQENPGLGTTIHFACGFGTGNAFAFPPTECDTGIMVVSFAFPNCWDGENLDSPDHISHMSYPVMGRCPASHPVTLPRLKAFFRYEVGTGPIGTITLDSGPHYTAHMDFFNAWDPTALQRLVTNCINAGIDCDKNPSFTVFSDVRTEYWASEFIERVYAAGITGGCGLTPLTYCPEEIVTRAQMAVFLLRGIHSSSYTPPGVGGNTGFTDVSPSYWSAAWIKQLAAEGITAGCDNGNYCPEAPINRAQMAVFLLRAKHGSSYTPPAVGSSTGFGDVPGNHWAAAWIKQLVAEGITVGCESGNYCPEAPVTRAQMAVFLTRTFNLP